MTPDNIIEDGGLAGLIGAFLPLIIALIVQSNWKTSAQAVAAFLICLGVAVLTSFLSQEVRLSDPDWSWVIWFGAMYGSAMTTYARFWKPTKVAPRIEAATNLSDGAPPA